MKLKTTSYQALDSKWEPIIFSPFASHFRKHTKQNLSSLGINFPNYIPVLNHSTAANKKWGRQNARVA